MRTLAYITVAAIPIICGAVLSAAAASAGLTLLFYLASSLLGVNLFQ